MEIQLMDYPVPWVHKFYVEYKNKKYTCFIQPYRDFVVTGYTTHDSIDHEYVHGKIEDEILANCYSYWFCHRKSLDL